MTAPKSIESLIHTIRGQKVILDADLAALYAVPTIRLNEQVKRNAARFPADFTFRLTAGEWVGLEIAICDIEHASSLEIRLLRRTYRNLR